MTDSTKNLFDAPWYVFSSPDDEITVIENESGRVLAELDDVKNACAQLMQQGEAVYLQYRQMLTEKQWNFMIAIAKEGSVTQITSAEFLRKYKIGTKHDFTCLYRKN